ncbi:TetR/AcrR family transcriptional regulator [Spongiactinospora rosea]|uniref:TetR/AcrR family transcriptional regulator n=1 Tax=Spongiactinospora rosea TaxID=2248750 RepID=UPI0013143B21|nr:TetR/AcrR family transcriptional regulator [Spongiactinospora rosea]
MLDSAAAEFVLHGYGDATMQAVAARIGMTKGALYAHFRSKQGLAGVLIDQFLTSWADTYTRNRRSGVSAEVALHRSVMALARGLQCDIRTRAAIRLLTDGPAASADLTAIHIPLLTLIRQAQSEGAIVANYPAEVVTRLLLAFVWYFSRAPREPAGRADHDAERACGVLLDLLRADRCAAPVHPGG